jgi:hypothetical protein
LQNFTWPTLAAIYHFQDAVLEATRSGASRDDLKRKYYDAVGVQVDRSGFNQSFVDFGRTEIASRLAAHHLFDLAGLYETWVDAIVGRFNVSNPPHIGKQLQFPTTVSSGSAAHGVAFALRELSVNESNFMRQEILPVVRQHKKYSRPALNNLLIAYRAYKELRNCLIHRGGVADGRAEDRSMEYEALTPADLNLTRKPAFSPMRQGAKVEIPLEAVGGLSEVLLRIVTTIDAELSVTAEAEEELWLRWCEHYGMNAIRFTPKKADMAARMKHFAQHAHLPVPTDPLVLVPWLEHRGIRFLR